MPCNIMFLPNRLQQELRPGVNFIDILQVAFFPAQIPKAQKNSQVISHFALLGSICIKAAHVGEIDPYWF